MKPPNVSIEGILTPVVKLALTDLIIQSRLVLWQRGNGRFAPCSRRYRSLKIHFSQHLSYIHNMTQCPPSPTGYIYHLNHLMSGSRARCNWEPHEYFSWSSIYLWRRIFVSSFLIYKGRSEAAMGHTRRRTKAAWRYEATCANESESTEASSRMRRWSP
jgi:hypothetical protein